MNDLLIEYIVAIADALDGETEATSAKTGDRLRDALKRIAVYFGANTVETGKELPAVTAANNGKVLKVVEGAWALADDSNTTELPAVTADNNGKVLKVVEGAWALADDSNTVELPAVTAENAGQVLKVDAEGHWVVGTIE